jgi:putative MATE family efflux protein
MARDLTSGSLARHVLHLAWPTAAAMGLRTAYNLVDAVFVGRIGPGAIAAVSLVFPVAMVLFALAGGLGIGTTSLVAQALGRRDFRLAGLGAAHSFLLCAVTGGVVTAAGLALERTIFTGLGAGPGVLPMVRSYGTWILAGAPFVFMSVAAGSILRAEGDMKTPMATMIAAVCLNAVLDPLLIFGLGPFPRLEVAGAAIATFSSQGAGCVLLLAYVLSGRPTVKLSAAAFRVDGGVIARILVVGIPTSVNQLVMSLGFMGLLRIVGRFGTEALAAYGLVMRLNEVVVLPCLGIAAAVITIVGQNVGAGRIDRARSAAWKAAAFAMVVMEAVGVVFYLLPGAFLGAFTGDGAVLHAGTGCLRAVSPVYMFIGLGIVMGAAFQGSGRGIPALVVTALRLIVVAIPGALLLSRIAGLDGVWLAIAGSNVVSGLASAVWFALSPGKARGHAGP